LAGSAESLRELFGGRTESVATTAIVVVLVLVAAGVSLLRRGAALLVVVAGFAVALAVLDLREAVHQHRESRGALVLVATILAFAHAAAAVLAVGAVVERRRLRTTAP
jgi:hypothetical protein